MSGIDLNAGDWPLTAAEAGKLFPLAKLEGLADEVEVGIVGASFMAGLGGLWAGDGRDA